MTGPCLSIPTGLNPSLGVASAVGKLCGVRRQSVYWWIKEWKVEGLVDALKFSRASGIPIEKFAGETIDAERSEEIQ